MYSNFSGFLPENSQKREDGEMAPPAGGDTPLSKKVKYDYKMAMVSIRKLRENCYGYYYNFKYQLPSNQIFS